jgi:hypothetical protein
MRFTFSNPLGFAFSGTRGPARAIVSWQGMGVVLVAVMLARWVWVFAAPPEIAPPATTSWQKEDATEDLFGHGTDVDTAAATVGNIRLIGVFAHRTAGFAVLQIDGKQVGGGLGAEVAPGLRLVETQADHVLLERGGTRLRVDLASGMPSGITPAASAGTTNLTSQALPDSAHLDTIPPAQRAAMQQELDNFRRRR